MSLHYKTLLAILLFLGCNPIEKTDLQVVYAKSRDGLYLYDLKDGTTKKIFSTETGFLNNSLYFISDSFVKITQRTKKYLSTYPISHDEIEVINYTYMVNIYTAENFLCNKTHTYKKDKIYFSSLELDKSGNTIIKKDTTYPIISQASSIDEMVFGKYERFYSESEKRDSMYFYTRKGSLYFNNKGVDTIFLAWNEPFDRKFGNGYYNPTLSNDKTKVITQFMPGFLKSGTAIYEISVQDKTKVKILETDTFFEDSYFKPKYSPDDTKLLLGRNNRETEDRLWQHDLYIYDLNTKKKKKIGICGDYVWKPKYSR